MSKKEFIKEDVVNLLGGATSLLNGLKDEMEEKVRDKVEKLVHKFNLVDKDEIDIIKDILEKNRIENEKLKKKIISLETKLKNLSKTSKIKNVKKSK